MDLKQISSWSKVLQKERERVRPAFFIEQRKPKKKKQKQQPQLSLVKWG